MIAERLACRAAVWLLLAAPAFSETLVTWKKQVLESKFYAEGASFGDINGDGKSDIVYGPFWFEGPGFTTRHTYFEPKEYNIVGYSDNFFAYVRDLNGDGFKDILIIGFPGKEARLYLNPGNDVANYPNWPAHVVADVVDDESPEFADLTGDGKPEIVCAHKGQFGYFEPDWKDVAKPWSWHPVSEDVGAKKFTHGLGIGDVNGDGRMDIMEAKRWWEAPANSPSPKPQAPSWISHVGNFAQGGAQMFAYDFNGDGRNDIVTSLQAHGYGLAWFENKGGDGPAGWTKHLITGKEPWENEYGIRFSQPHAMALVDVDGDGLKDLITGCRYFAHNGHGPDEHDPPMLYWFQTKRSGKTGVAKVEFIPHVIDGDTGVGTQLTAGDIDGDGLVDVVIGNKYGCRVLLQRREQVDAERYAVAQPKKFYGPDSVQPKDYKAGQPAEEAVRNMTLPAGFKAEVMLAEPDIVQPIAFCWDERGRLWVAEGNSYPQKRPDSKPDRILIFEDTKGTGKFDKRTVFMDGLNLVSGIEVGFGGVWVGAAPELLFIPRDANDKPGKPRVLLDGFGYQDTHETLNSFIWGPDGWLYGCHGVFTHSRVGKPGTPDDQRTPINAGVWRYHPVRQEFEVFAHGTSNPWGLDYDEHGEFFVTACVIPHFYHIVPGARYQRQGGQHFNPYTYEDIKTIADHAHYAGNIRDNAHWGDRHTKTEVPVADDTNAAGGGHAHCGLCIYQGDNFPPEYRGQFIFGNLHGHRLVNDFADPAGSTFVGKHRADFLRSNDHWFIPIQQKVGPDGALYVSDWSDKQVCHQGSAAVDKWDRGNGRIYRISYEGANKTRNGGLQPPSKTSRESGKNEASGSAASAEVASTAVSNRRSLELRAPFDLAKLSDEHLVEMALVSENQWFARMARRVLMERMVANKPSIQYIMALMQPFAALRESLDDPCHFFWLIHQITPNGEPSIFPSQANDKWVHSAVWSLRLYEEQHRQLEKLPVYRRTKEGDQYEVSTLTKIAREDKSPLVRRELASLLQRLPLDKRSDIAIALLRHKEDANDPMIPLLIWYGIEPLVGADGAAGMKLAAASKMDKVTGFIYRRLSSDEKGRVALLRAAADMPDAAQREKVLAMTLDSARSSGKLAPSPEWKAIAARLRANASPATLEKIDELSALFGDADAVNRFREALKNQRVNGVVRDHAIAVLVQVRDAATAKILQGLVVDRETPSPLRRKCIQALVALPDSQTAGSLVNAYKNLSADEKTDVVATLASSLNGATALLQGVVAKQIEPQMLTPFLVRQLQTLNNADLNVLLAKALGGTVNPAKADLAQQKAKWRPLLMPAKLKAADPKKGREIFKGTCATCHKLFGEGSNVGPDITGSNRANLDYLLDNVLDPSAVIGKGYELNVFSMKDGRILSGIVKEENNATARLAMPGGIELVLNKPEVGKRETLKISMMPEGQFDALGPENAAHLVAYLQSNAGAAGDNLPAIRVGGALEGETIKVTDKTGGNARPQPMGAFKQSRWSGGRQLWWTEAKIGDVLTLALPVEKAGMYALKAVLTKARDYGIVEVALDGKPLRNGSLDLFNFPEVITSGELDWGSHELSAGEHKLTVKVTGSNPKAVPRRMFGLDYVKLEKK